MDYYKYTNEFDRYAKTGDKHFFIRASGKK